MSMQHLLPLGGHAHTKGYLSRYKWLWIFLLFMSISSQSLFSFRLCKFHI